MVLHRSRSTLFSIQGLRECYPSSLTNVILSRWISDLWLATSTTGSTSSGGGVTGSNSISLYNPGCTSIFFHIMIVISCYTLVASSSFSDLNTPFQIQYGSGAAEGTLGKDTVQFSGFQVTGQTFGVYHPFIIYCSIYGV